MKAKFAILALLGLVAISSAQTGAVDDGFQLTTHTPHPLAEIVWQLESKYDWLLTYEEPNVLRSDELIEKTAPTGAPVLVRQASPLSVRLSAERLSTADPKQKLTTIQDMLEMYTKGGASDSFRAVQDGRYIHIEPATIRGDDGNTQPFDPILSTRVSFEEQRFANLYSFVETVLEKVSAKRGVSIVLEDVPNNLFRQSSVFEVAQDEPARDVLARAFWAINGPRLTSGLDAVGLTWSLMYDPTARQYWFHVGAVNVGAVENSAKGSSKSSHATEQLGADSESQRPNGIHKLN